MNKEQIVEALSELTVLELSELKKSLEETWGVEAAAAMPAIIAGPAVAGAGEDAAAEEATDFEVTLAEISTDKKIAIIKVVREVTGLGLKEAKELVEKAPSVVKDSAPKAEADEITKKIEAAGGKATLKGL